MSECGVVDMEPVMKRLLFVAFALIICASAWADLSYLLVPIDQSDAMMARLDVLKGPPPTEHYTDPVQSWISTYPFVLFPVGPEAQSVLTPEEWGARLSDMPVEFRKPRPFP